MRRAPRSRRYAGKDAAAGPASPSRTPSGAGNQQTLRTLGVKGSPSLGDQRDAEEAQADHAAEALTDGGAAPQRADYEQYFGTDFSGVRVHTSGPARTAAQALGARAFTVGEDIFLGPRAPQLDSLEGRALMAHELGKSVV